MTVTVGVESAIVTPSTTPVGPASEIQPIADDVVTGQKWLWQRVYRLRTNRRLLS